MGAVTFDTPEFVVSAGLFAAGAPIIRAGQSELNQF
jgi:hypothetical protein